MEINIAAAGSVKKNYLQQGIDDYIKRLKPFTDINIIEVRDEKIPSNPGKGESQQILNKEGERLLERIPDRSYLIALDVKGKPSTSTGLAKSIQNIQIQGYSSISFVIGGALGLSKEVLEKCDYRLSLSHMTFTHQMVRLILVEQVYRSFKIMRGEPYHL